MMHRNMEETSRVNGSGPGHVLANHIARGRQEGRIALGPGDLSKGLFVERCSARHLPTLYDNAEICMVSG